MTKVVIVVDSNNASQPYDFKPASDLVESFKNAGISTTVYTSLDTKEGQFNGAVVQKLDGADTFPKKVNAIVATEKKARSQARYLHVVSDSIKLVSDPKKFLELHEKMMEGLKLKSWLNTVCDPVNYVYAKYNPRVQIDLGEEGIQKFGSASLLFTSNANSQWMCFDLDASDEDLRFDEQFTIPMYFIIEFLARRRAKASQHSLDFMNMYPTIQAEQDVFESLPSNGTKQDDELFKEENEKFKALNLNISPTNVVDKVLESLYYIFKGQT